MWRGHTNVTGKKLLCVRREALRQLFGDTCIHSYWRHVHPLIHPQLPGASEGRCHGGEGGAAGRHRRARSSALEHLRESLKVRIGQARPSGHTGHQQKLDEMEECIG